MIYFFFAVSCATFSLNSYTIDFKNDKLKFCPDYKIFTFSDFFNNNNPENFKNTTWALRDFEAKHFKTLLNIGECWINKELITVNEGFKCFELLFKLKIYDSSFEREIINKLFKKVLKSVPNEFEDNSIIENLRFTKTEYRKLIKGLAYSYNTIFEIEYKNDTLSKKDGAQHSSLPITREFLSMLNLIDDKGLLILSVLLKGLNISEVVFNEISPTQISLDKIKNLEIIKSLVIRNKDFNLKLPDSFKNLDNIRNLDLLLPNCKNLNLEEVALLKNLQSLKLDVYHCSIKCLQQFRNLTSLEITSHSFNPANIDFIFSLPNLQYLNLKGRFCFENIDDSKNLVNLKSLECCNVGEEFIKNLKDFLNRTPNIKTIILQKCVVKSTTESEIVNLENLQYLKIVDAAKNNKKYDIVIKKYLTLHQASII